MNQERRHVAFPFSPSAAFTAFGVAALAACSLTTDFSGLQGNGAATGNGDGDGGDGGQAAVPEASAPVEAGASSEAGATPPTDAGTMSPVDAKSPADAKSPLDAASPADVGAPDVASSGAESGVGFCASLSPAPRLCADFDEGLATGTGWTTEDITANATVKTDTVNVSPPASMLSAVAPPDAPASARLNESLPLLATQIHVEFEMLLPTGGGPFELCAIHESTPTGEYGLFYKLEQGSLLVYLGTAAGDGGVTPYVYPLGVPSANWMHVAIDFTIGDAGSVVVRHDGAVVVNATGIQTASAGTTQLFVALGLESPSAATARVNFDNVIVDWP